MTELPQRIDRSLPRDEQLRLLAEGARLIRRRNLRLIERAGLGHVGGDLSAADIVATLYLAVLDVRREQAAQPFAVFSGFSDSARVAVRTQSQWNEIWARIAGNATPAPEAPEIDFATEMVIVAAMGTRPSGGYAIRIDRVVRRGNTMWAEVTSSAPGSGCMNAAALTTPVDLVVVQRTTGKVLFVENSEVRNC